MAMLSVPVYAIGQDAVRVEVLDASTALDRIDALIGGKQLGAVHGVGRCGIQRAGGTLLIFWGLPAPWPAS